MNVAETILAQLGGRRFIVMTGAKDFVGGNDALQFRIPRAKGINVVRIKLTPADLYDVEFGALRGVNYTVKKTVEGVYDDMLQAIFTDATGLYTRL